MTALLDTHAFLWWCLDDPQLSETARAVISSEDNTIVVSAATAWEIAIKWKLGKLPLPEEAREFVPSRIALNAFDVLDIAVKHAVRVSTLPDNHRDPFDRILVAQAQAEEMPIITADSMIAQYDVRTIW